MMWYVIKRLCADSRWNSFCWMTQRMKNIKESTKGFKRCVFLRGGDCNIMMMMMTRNGEDDGDDDKIMCWA